MPSLVDHRREKLIARIARRTGKGVQPPPAPDLRWLLESLESRTLLSLFWTRENTSDSNTLALYHFNETGGTVADNAQGSATRDLTLSSASMFTSGIDFRGQNGRFLNMSFGQAVSAAQAIPTDWSQGLTISFWIKTADQADASRTPVWLSDSGWKNEAGFSYHPTWSSPYRPEMMNNGSMHGTAADINTRLLDGNWHHVAVTHRPGVNNGLLYVDNVLLHQWSDGGADLSPASQLAVGTGFTGINAYIDELLIQKQELTDFSAAHGPSFGWTAENAADANTLALYHFNDAAGSTTAVNAQGNTGRNINLPSTNSIVTGTDYLGRTNGRFMNMSLGQASTVAQAIPTDWTQPFTISFWMKTGDQADAGRTPVWISDAGWRSDAGFAYHPTWSSPYRPEMMNSGTMFGTPTDLNSRLLNNQWHHVAITHEPVANQARFYIDNVLLHQWGDGGADLSPAAQLIVGSGFSGATAYIDELLVQRTLLSDFSDAHGKTNWTRENASDNNTLALYHFNDAAGSTTAVNAQGDAGRHLNLPGTSSIVSGIDFMGRSSRFLNMNFGTASTPGLNIPTDWNAGMTISFWMKTADQADASRTPVWLTDSGWKNEAGFAYHPTWSFPYRPEMKNYGTMFGTPQDLNSRLLNNQWHHVAITHSGGGTDYAKFYVDNELLHGWSDGGADLSSAVQVILGTGFAGVNAYIDELLIQRGELTDFSNGYLPSNELPTGNPDSYTTPRNTQLTISAPGVLANDTDVDGDPLTAVNFTNPSHGTLTPNSNGGFTYIPTTGYMGSDSFTYRPSDGTPGNVTTVTINIVNREPVAVADGYRANVNTQLVVGVPGVLGNDSDPDGDSITAHLHTGASHGTVTLDPNGSFTYTPTTNYSGPDSFKYFARDSHSAESSPVVVNIAVGGNTLPTAVDDFYMTLRATQLVVNAADGVIDNDDDPNGDPLRAELVDGTDNGTLVLNPDGSFTYNPSSTFTGADFFTYKLHDTHGYGNTATVRIDVDPPPTNGIGLRASAVTSSTVTLKWNPIAGASAVRVYLGAAPHGTGDLPDQWLKATLGGAATNYQFKGLAPDVDFFFRVEIDTPGGEKSANIHARTRGGPGLRAHLDPTTGRNPVRNVHAYAKDILQIVIADNWDNRERASDDGAAYQSGIWTVTRRSDGVSIPIQAKYRMSAPVYQPDYAIGFGGGTDYTDVDLDHRIFLKFGSNILVNNRTHDILTITGPLGVSFTLPFNDQYLETPIIQVNQVGYNPRARERYAYVSGWMGDGGALNLDGTNGIPSSVNVLIQPSDPLSQRHPVKGTFPVASRTPTADDSDIKARVKEIDLKALPTAEDRRYRIHLPGVGVSFATEVSEEAVYKAYYTVARGLFLNRWAGDLRLSNTEWARPQDHVRMPDNPNVSVVYTSEHRNWREFIPRNTPLDNPKDVIGGHHDAGDFDLRPGHTLLPQFLMRAYENTKLLHGTTTLTDGQLTLPESGNGIPDLLDEALWNIQSWEALQEADGGVRAGVEANTHPDGIYNANEERMYFWTYARDPQLTGRAAGIFAQASYLLARLDPDGVGLDDERADALRTKAARAYTWAVEQNPRPVDYHNKPIADAYILYSAGELYRLTGDPKYKTAYEAAWDRVNFLADHGKFTVNQGEFSDIHGGTDGNQHRVMPDFILGYYNASGAKRADILTGTRDILSLYANRAVNETQNLHAHRSPRSVDIWDWGQGHVTGRYLDSIYGRINAGMTADEKQQFFDTMSLAADYALGANPASMTFISGLGSRHPNDVLHLDTEAFLANGLPQLPGIPVYGPVEEPSLELKDYLPGTEAFYPRITSYATNPIPRALRFGDMKSFVRSAEFDLINTQAPMAQLFALLIGGGAQLPSSYKPGGLDHRNPIASFGPSINRAPVVEAGWPTRMFINSTVPLNGQAVDDGGTLTTRWSGTGPGTVTFNNPNTLTATPSFSVPGTYTLTLLAIDSQELRASDTVTVTVDPASGNQFPRVFAGADRTIIWRDDIREGPPPHKNNITLHATIYDDSHKDLQVFTWSMISGPGTVTFHNLDRRGDRWPYQLGSQADEQPDPPPAGQPPRVPVWADNAIFSAPGKYVLRMTASDGTLSAYDEITVWVKAQNNAPPAVNAGADRTVALSSGSVTLSGTVSDDSAGLPTYLWEQIGGINNITITNPTSASTTASFTQAGTYILRLTVTDSGAVYSSDTVTITVNSSGQPDNIAPVAQSDSYSAQRNTSIAPAAPGVLGNDHDPDNGPSSITAQLVTGPAAGTYSSFTLNPNGSFTFVPATNWTGTTTFIYRAWDGNLASADTTVSLTIQPDNLAPTAAAESYTANRNTQIAPSPPGVLANDDDPDDRPNPITAVLWNGPAAGTYTTFNLKPDGSFTFVPANNWLGTTSFAYRAYDGQLYSAVTTVTLNIVDPPTQPFPNWDAGNDGTQRSSLPVLVNDPWAPPDQVSYRSEAGKQWENQINAWYSAGSIAGLTQDKFRSFDGNHSSLRHADPEKPYLRYYPQLEDVTTTNSYTNQQADIFNHELTFGVQSFAEDAGEPWVQHTKMAIVEYNIRKNLYRHYDAAASDPYNETWYQHLYTHNFLLIQPAIDTYGRQAPFQDRFSFLLPYYLQSVGISGSDSRMLKPIVFAAAALNNQIKTRALRSGVYAPLLMYLFKKAFTGDIATPSSHQAAYDLPAEAYSTTVDWTQTPFLNELINSARNLTHVPPVARVSEVSTSINGGGYTRPGYKSHSVAAINAVLRPNETAVITFSLSGSWVDTGRSLSTYSVVPLRNGSSGMIQNLGGGRFTLTVPWQNLANRTYDNRSDFLLLVTDSSGYKSAPAYVSIKHVQSSEATTYGIPAFPQPPSSASLNSVDDGANLHTPSQLSGEAAAPATAPAARRKPGSHAWSGFVRPMTRTGFSTTVMRSGNSWLDGGLELPAPTEEIFEVRRNRRLRLLE